MSKSLEATQIILPPGPDYALRIKHEYRVGWEQWYWFETDLHWDSPEWQRRLYHKHARMAKDRGAFFVGGGDRFDGISGRNDKRGTKGTLRPEHLRGAYFDTLVDDGVEEFREYADNYVYEGEGNHEAAVRKMCETDLTARWIEKMNAIRSKHLPPIFRAGYDGWIVISFETNGRRQNKKIKIHHGHGGGGEVTKGVIQDQRAAASTEGYDLYIHGHVHERYQMPQMAERLMDSDRAGHYRVTERERLHLRVGSYKADFRRDGAATWHTQRGGRSKPLGGVFVKFYCPEQDVIAMSPEFPYVNYDNLE